MGLLGKNGAGKTTLFKILTGELPFEHGTVVIPKQKRVGILAQIPEYPAAFTGEEVLRTAFAHLDELREKMKALEERLQEPDALRAYGALEERFEAMGGYDTQVRTNKVCNGLGITPRMRQELFSSLSGGEKTRLTLAGLILQDTDILLLDEPTNHLDMQAVSWLEEFLVHYRGTVVAISHDRYFLDHAISRIIEIEDGQAEFYSGNYSFYVQEKQARREELERQYAQQERKVAQLQYAADRMHTWAQGHDNPDLHKRAVAIERRIERLSVLEKPKTEKVMTASFSIKEGQSADVLVVKDLSKAYGEKVLFQHVDLLAKDGERIAIIGDNGCGKTTFLNILLQKVLPDSGVALFGPAVKNAYLPQIIQFENDNYTVLETVTSALKLTLQAGRNRLAAFQFTGDEVFQKVSSLSGGERSRLMLCILMYKELNMLILDEPTNHLDIQSREWIETAIQEYDGNLLFVSHDRYFINKFANRIWDFRDGTVVDFKGGFEKYMQMRRLEAAQAETPANQQAPKKQSKSPRDRRKSPYTLEKQIAAAERDIGRLEERLKKLDAELVQNAADYEKLQDLLAEKEQASGQLEELYETWAVLCEERDQLDG